MSNGTEGLSTEAVEVVLTPDQRRCRASAVACGSCEDCERKRRHEYGIRR